MVFSVSNIKLAIYFIRILSLMFGAVLAGYTIIDYKKDFLRSFIKPINQFIIGILLAISFIDYDTSWFVLVIKLICLAAVFTICLQGFKQIIGKENKQIK